MADLASVLSIPARPSGSGSPTDFTSLEKPLAQTLAKMSAVKATPSGPPPTTSVPAVARSPAPSAVILLRKWLTPGEEHAILLMRVGALAMDPSPVTGLLTCQSPLTLCLSLLTTEMQQTSLVGLVWPSGLRTAPGYSSMSFPPADNLVSLALQLSSELIFIGNFSEVMNFI